MDCLFRTANGQSNALALRIACRAGHQLMGSSIVVTNLAYYWHVPIAVLSILGSQ